MSSTRKLSSEFMNALFIRTFVRKLMFLMDLCLGFDCLHTKNAFTSICIYTDHTCEISMSGGCG